MINEKNYNDGSDSYSYDDEEETIERMIGKAKVLKSVL